MSNILTDSVFNYRFDRIQNTNPDSLVTGCQTAKTIEADGTKKIHMHTGLAVITIFKHEGNYVYTNSLGWSDIFAGTPRAIWFTEDFCAMVPML